MRRGSCESIHHHESGKWIKKKKKKKKSQVNTNHQRTRRVRAYSSSSSSQHAKASIKSLNIWREPKTAAILLILDVLLEEMCLLSAGMKKISVPAPPSPTLRASKKWERGTILWRFFAFSRNTLLLWQGLWRRKFPSLVPERFPAKIFSRMARVVSDSLCWGLYIWRSEV